MRNFVAALLALGAFCGPVAASTLTWADWTSADATTASGTLGSNTVSFSGAINPTAQTDGTGINYWAPNSGIYTPTGNAADAPQDSDIIRLIGGPSAGTQTLTFGSAVTNPYMAIMSLGRPNALVTYDFDSPFTIVNQGAGYWGGSATALSTDDGFVLKGYEGHGLIQFQGTFTSISWTIPLAENWHGFQVAVDTPEIPLPATGILLIAGLGGLGMLRRKRIS